jgi:hypothetical protein
VMVGFAALTVLGLLAVTDRSRLGTEAGAEALGFFTVSTQIAAVLSAVVAWAVLRRRPGVWPWWRVAVFVLPFYVAARLLLGVLLR